MAATSSDHGCHDHVPPRTRSTAPHTLDRPNLFRHDAHGQEQFKTSDGRWWIVTYAAHLTPLDCPTCDSCAEDVMPDDIGREGPDRVICKSCLASA